MLVFSFEDASLEQGEKKKDVRLILHSASREETAVAALNQAQVS